MDTHEGSHTRRGPRRPPLFKFDGKEVAAAVDEEQMEELNPVLQEVVAAVDEEQVEELDPVLQKLKATPCAMDARRKEACTRQRRLLCRMQAALQGVRSKFTRGMASLHNFDMFSISEQGVLVTAETCEVRGPDPMMVLPKELRLASISQVYELVVAPMRSEYTYP
jgi:hypothetical protein